jgi:hypothetical protein
LFFIYCDLDILSCTICEFRTFTDSYNSGVIDHMTNTYLYVKFQVRVLKITSGVGKLYGGYRYRSMRILNHKQNLNINIRMLPLLDTSKSPHYSVFSIEILNSEFKLLYFTNMRICSVFRIQNYHEYFA